MSKNKNPIKTPVPPIPTPVFTTQIINGVSTLVGTANNDTMTAPAGVIPPRFIAAGANAFYAVSNADGGAGDDTMYAYNSSTYGNGSTLHGNIGNDKLYGSNMRDALHGGDGNDTILAGDGSDLIWGDAGNDNIDGGLGIDFAYFDSATSAVTVDLALTTAQNTGGAGIDTIVNVEGLFGSNFNDVLLGDATANTLDGGAGNDTLDGRAGNDTINGGAGDDTISGGDGNDIISGGDGTNTIYAGAGDDVINKTTISTTDGISNDMIDGGTGTDTLAINLYYGSSLNVDLSKGTVTGNSWGNTFTQTVSNIENVSTNVNNATLIGNDGDNVLTGAYSSVLIGNAGNDKLTGFFHDQMTGGTGADTFATYLSQDTILDFSAAEGDKIDISVWAAWANTTSRVWNTVITFLDNGAAFTGVIGQVHVVADATVPGLQHIEADFYGDKSVFYSTDVYSSTTLTANDFFFY
ncbi:MAG: hypothetical protein HOP02_01650 [Methylococcaceae bacterium]|nr:hypothetical protein [Methylococcaceae bacterium]